MTITTQNKDLKLVEHLGSGLNRILTAYSKESFEVRDYKAVKR